MDDPTRLTMLVSKAATRTIRLADSPQGREDDLDDVFQGIGNLIHEIEFARIPDPAWCDALLNSAKAVRSLAGAAFVEAQRMTPDARSFTVKAKSKLDHELVVLDRVADRRLN